MRTFTALCVLLCTLIVFSFPRALLTKPEAAGAPRETATPNLAVATRQPLAQAATKPLTVCPLASLPAAFIENRGQVDENVRFHSRHGGMTAYFTKDAFVLELVRREAKTQVPSTPNAVLPARGEHSPDAVITGAAVFLSFEGASSDVVVDGIDPLPGRSNYFLGNDRSQWHTNVPGYSSIRYRGLYRGVDVVVREQENRLEYDLILEPGADLDQVVIRCEGAEALCMNESGELIVETVAGAIEQPRPHTYQVGPAGEQIPVDCSYRFLGEARFGFEVTNHRRELALVVDPGLVFSTFLGGSDDDAAYAMARDPSGSIVLTGTTQSLNFPTTPGAYDTSYNTGPYGGDAFVARLDASGSALLSSTFLGGAAASDAGYAIALDASGAVVVTGYTNSSDFPTTPGAYDTTHNGGHDTFVAKLNASNSALLYSTYIGGSDLDWANALALDANGAAVVGGIALSTDFPTTPGAYDTTPNGEHDAFVAKLDASGSTLVYSTLVGGTKLDELLALAVDSTGKVVVAGRTYSKDFPTTPGAYDRTFNSNGLTNAFVTKLNASGSTLIYSTFLGGNTLEEANAIALDPAGNTVIAGFTYSSDFPTTPGAYDETGYPFSGDAFVTKLNASGTALIYSTLLGGSDIDDARGLALDATGAAVVSGFTASSDFPTTPGAYESTAHGGEDPFLAKLDASGRNLRYSTLFGASGFSLDGDERALGVALDGAGAIVVGRTESYDFPTTPGAYDTTFNGGAYYGDAFVTKVDTCVAFARNYGSGWPGTLGVPSLTISAPPVLCSQVSISVGNSRGATTAAAFIVGFSSAAIPTALGGTLLVVPAVVLPYTLPAAGASVPYAVLCGDQFCGLGLYLQAFELDPGASQDVSFSAGLELVHGK